MGTLTRTVLHKRMTTFVDWIRPTDDTEEAIRKQADEIRNRVRAKAHEDGLIVTSTPSSGSFAKKTGLRRHMLGHSVVEGQDVDLPFVVAPRTRDDEAIASLLDRFYKYAHSSYPDTSKDVSRSSVALDFKSTKLRYDLVPMLQTDVPDRQVLLRSDGTRLTTSVWGHVEFVRARTRLSNEQPGRVKFNECVRLLKWWRTVRTNGDEAKFPSIIVDLLSAWAFDHVGVHMTYGETLGAWFGVLADAARRRAPIVFGGAGALPDGVWVIVDPENPTNNVASRWRNLQVEDVTEWLEAARDGVQRALAADRREDHPAAMNELVGLFGSAFRNVCDKAGV